MSTRSRKKSPSVRSVMSSASQKRIAAAEAKEAVIKMELDANLAIDKKREELACLERSSRKAQRNISQYADVDFETLSDNDKIAFRHYVKERDCADEEAEAVKADILRLEETLARRKEDIVKSLEATNEKIDIIAEEEENVLRLDELSETSSETTARKVGNWLTTVPKPPAVPEIVQGEMEGATSSSYIQQPRYDTMMMNRLFKRQTPAPLSREVQNDTVFLNHRNAGLGTAKPTRREEDRHENEVKREGQNTFQTYHQDNYYDGNPQLPPINEESPPAQPPIGMDFVSQLAAALSHAFGPGTVGREREVIVKTPMDKDLPIYTGNPGEFCNFKAAFERSTKKFRFDSDENMARMHKALKGEAKRKVSHLMANPLNMDKLMETLEDCFGRPEFVLDYLVEKAKSCDKVEPSKPETLVAFGDAIEALITNICSYNKTDYMQNKQLTKELIDKLPLPLKSRWFEWRAEDENRETNLLYFSNWIKLKVKAARLQITPKVKTEDEEKVSASRRTKRGSATINIASSNDERKQYCAECNRPSHNTADCRKFAKKANKDKWDLAKEKKLCFLCLQSGHRTNDCKSENHCSVEGCDKKHHTVLHLHGRPKSTDVKISLSCTISSDSECETEDNTSTPEALKPTENTKEDHGSKTTTAGASVVEGTDGALPIIPVWLKGPYCTIKTYALLDTGASRSLIQEDLANELGLQGNDFEFTCRGFGGNVTKHKNAKSVEVDIAGYYRGSKFAQIDNVITVEKIGVAPYSLDIKEAKKRWPSLRRIKGKSMKEVIPRIIIGSPHRHLSVPREILCSQLGGPVATRTLLGWILEGDLSGSGTTTMCYLGGSSEDLDVTLHNLIKDSFRNEDFGIKPSRTNHSIEDKKALAIMEKTTVKVGNRWETGLLWRDENISLPDSYPDALKRLCATEKRMERDQLFCEAYKNKIQEYLNKGFIKKLSQEEVKTRSDKTFYIPHFGVINPNKPGKFRLVFDAAAKSKGTSLNDCLLTGPDLLRPLTTVLWNFRRHRIVICGDIEDMFHRVGIREVDQGSQRFLWRDGDSSKPPDVFEMKVMIFGATSSPSCAIFVKDRNAELMKSEFPDAYRAIKEDFYMDDCLTGANDEKEVIALRKDITHVNLEGGFHIKKWMSNSAQVMESIPPELQLKGAKSIIGDMNADYERVLGLWWDPVSDKFTFKTNFHKVNPDVLAGRQPTKREMCGLVMSLYDPLGFIGHYRVKGMILLQRVWNSGIGWDDEVSDDIFDDWLEWLSDINKITNVQIPRCYCMKMNEVASVELHTFTDASKEAYAAVCYFRVVMNSGVQVSLVSSKVKVAPLKKLTIPRLELQAAVLGTKLATIICEEIKIKIDKKFFWSDSRTVLSWIRSETARQPEFIANRIGIIQNETNTYDWRWIPTADNVADDATRICKQTEFSPESRWYNGPTFLHLSEEEWPSERRPENETATEDLETFADAFVLSSTNEDEKRLNAEKEKAQLINVGRFSSYTRLLRVVSAVIRVSKLWLAKARTADALKTRTPLYNVVNSKRISTANDDDLAAAERLLLTSVQQDVFGRADNLIKERNLKALCPYFDEFGLLRARGRIDNSAASEKTRRPIILPARHHVTDLIVDREHKRNAHTGAATVLNNLRQKYWIVNGRQAIRRCWSRCNHCRIQRAKPVIPEMGILPACRLSSGKYPFTFTGVDYFGPIEVTVGRRHEKRWGVIFCCMVTRAIHLEIAHGLSTDETMLALSRFIDARRRPNTIYSDNGTNFHGAIKELERAAKAENFRRIREEMGLEKINWKFIPPAAAHMGGAWERLIQAVKKVLKNVLHEKFPKDTVLLTTMKAAENIVNSRPLTYQSSDVDDPEPLTPNHFIKGGVDFGPSIPSDVDSGARLFREKWKESQSFANQIWKKWNAEYLPSLLDRKKWTEQVEPLEIGDLVLIVDDQLPRNSWVKAVVTATFPAKDGQVRAVEVSTRSFTTKKKTSLKRPVTKLCPLGLRIKKSDVMASNMGVGM